MQDLVELEILVTRVLRVKVGIQRPSEDLKNVRHTRWVKVRRVANHEVLFGHPLVIGRIVVPINARPRLDNRGRSH
eukprot:7264508-Heterocapsa_arctica.AAC.1